jgi:hypothetical protein
MRKSLIAFGLGLVLTMAGTMSLLVGTTGSALSQQCPNGNCPKK